MMSASDNIQIRPTDDQAENALCDECAVEIKGLNKWFKKNHVLRDINFCVKPGERIVIIGPSGSGKSTLVRCMNALEDYQTGTVSVEGIVLGDNVKNLDKVRRQVGMVFQHFNLFPHLTVLENCMLAPVWVKKEPRKVAQQQAMHYLEKVRITGHANKYPSQLSGGQQQRAAIARSLCMKPNIMLFDEPTSALDPEMIKGVLDTMAELAETGMTMVCITHEMEFARRVADRIVFMDEGQVIEDQPAQLFFNNPLHTRTKAFLNQIL